MLAGPAGQNEAERAANLTLTLHADDEMQRLKTAEQAARSLRYSVRNVVASSRYGITSRRSRMSVAPSGALIM